MARLMGTRTCKLRMTYRQKNVATAHIQCHSPETDMKHVSFSYSYLQNVQIYRQLTSRTWNGHQPYLGQLISYIPHGINR